MKSPPAGGDFAILLDNVYDKKFDFESKKFRYKPK